MTKLVKQELQRMTEQIEVLEQQIEALKRENAMSSTVSSQKEANVFMLEQCHYTLNILAKKKKYLSLQMDEPQQESANLYHELMLNKVRVTPNSLLQK